QERDECLVCERAGLAIVRMGQNLDMFLLGAFVEMDFAGSRTSSFCVMAKQRADDAKQGALHVELLKASNIGWESAVSSGQLEVDFAGDQVGDRDEIAQ